MTSALLALQSAFACHVLSSKCGSATVEASIACGHGISVQRRLDIYHHAYRARLVDALRDAFGHTATYLGDEWFDADALAFVQSHPSAESSLNNFGAGFAPWLRERYPCERDIAELAALDWALRRAFDGPDAMLLDLAALAAVPPEAWGRIGFAFVPTTTHLVLSHNTLALWHALDQGDAPTQAQALVEPSDVLIWRRGHQPHFRSLAAFESRVFTALRQGLSFAAVCERLAHALPALDVAVEAGLLLRRWVDEALLCGVVEPLTPH